MSLIDNTYFTGYRGIPNLDKPHRADLLQTDIERLEPKFFKEQFGYAFQKDMFANQGVPKYQIILKGGEFTDGNGDLQNWGGIENLLADYVYFYHVTDNYLTLSGAGYQSGTNENSLLIQPLTQPIKVWNMMIDKLKVLEELLSADYDSYSDLLIWKPLKYTNDFGI